MTETEWFTGNGFANGPAYLAGRGLASRQRCLFLACAYLDRHAHFWVPLHPGDEPLPTDERVDEAVVAGLRFAQGSLNAAGFAEAVEDARAAAAEYEAILNALAERDEAVDESFERRVSAMHLAASVLEHLAAFDATRPTWLAELCADLALFAGRSIPDGDGAYAAENAAFGALTREVFGNPFRPIAMDPAWRTGSVRDLAASIAKHWRFEHLPILADALEDAGCDAAALLYHLRDTTAAHMPGCWALELVRGG